MIERSGKKLLCCRLESSKQSRSECTLKRDENITIVIPETPQFWTIHHNILQSTFISGMNPQGKFSRGQQATAALVVVPKFHSGINPQSKGCQ
ncbi:hypothetical protein Hanom_Chr07g00579771 [Helianthus anomalus]